MSANAARVESRRQAQDSLRYNRRADFVPPRVQASGGQLTHLTALLLSDSALLIRSFQKAAPRAWWTHARWASAVSAGSCVPPPRPVCSAEGGPPRAAVLPRCERARGLRATTATTPTTISTTRAEDRKALLSSRRMGSKGAAGTAAGRRHMKQEVHRDYVLFKCHCTPFTLGP
jgi:hypothetical protein